MVVIFDFLWYNSTKDRHNKIVYIHYSHDKVTRRKEAGGLGFRDLETFNMALHAEQAWRLMFRPNSLCFKLLKGIYFTDDCIMSAEAPAASSWAWKSRRGVSN